MDDLFHMSLAGIGDWSRAMREAGAQLAPYRAYLDTAKTAADRRALSLAWRTASDAERRDLDRRLRDRHDNVSEPAKATRRRDGRRDVPSGAWVVLESRPGFDEEPETTFDAFVDARDVHECPPRSRDRGTVIWDEGSRIAVRGSDREGRALLLARLPIANASAVRVADRPAEPSGAGAEKLLFLRPNTWPLECQRRALRSLADEPSPRVAPLLRLASTRPTWTPVVAADVPEEAWLFLRGDSPAMLRDGTAEQRQFVRTALGTPDFALLEGPPGSGKTTAICELIAQVARAGKRVLLVASTHVAVDNVLERLMEWQDSAAEKLVMPIRIGDEQSVSDAVASWTFRRLRDTWHGEILDFLERPRGAGSAGANARQMLRDALTATSNDSAIANLLLDSSNLVCGTTIGILQHPAIKAGGVLEPFDLLILDEASKTTFTEFLVPAVHAKRWVIVGDRRQLSPYVDETDLAANLRRLLPPDVGRAAVLTFVASSAVSRAGRVRSLVAVGSDTEAHLLAEEAAARNVVAVDLDRVTPAPLRGVDGACAELLFADVVFGRPETIAAWQHRLPGDLQNVAGDMPALPDWEAHRRTLGSTHDDEPVQWENEIAWRELRAFELRDNAPEQKRYLGEVRALRPRTLGDWYLAERRLRTRRDGSLPTVEEVFEDDLATMRRVSMPSILEVLQIGAGSLGWDHATTLTHGLGAALGERMVSLSFQHRMHPDISAFPRDAFYSREGLLQDASAMSARREWSYRRYARRGVWLAIEPPRRRWSDAGQNTNPAEANVLMNELRAFAEWAARAPYPGKDPNAPWEVAVLTFYRGQEKLLRARLRDESGQHGNAQNFRLGRGRVHVTLCTVDRFQGHEADVVFLSFVKSGSAGFLNSPNRLCVALTRARYQLVLIGNQRWMASPDCRSELLHGLGSSPLYARDLAWEKT